MGTDNYAYLMADTNVDEMRVNLKRCRIAITELDKQIEACERELRQLKNYRRTYIDETVAPLMAELGLSRAVDADGHQLELKTKFNVTVNDYAELAKLMTFMGDGGLLKTTFTLGHLPPETVQQIKAYCAKTVGVEPELTQSVHPQTLKKWVREITGGGDVEGAIIDINNLPDCLSVYTYNDVIIK